VDAVATQEPPDRVCPEAHEVRQGHVLGTRRAERRVEERDRWGARPRRRARTGRGRLVEGERGARDETTGRDVLLVEGLQRMAHGDRLGDRALDAVASRASSSSPSGTAGGRGCPENSLAPV